MNLALLVASRTLVAAALLSSMAALHAADLRSVSVEQTDNRYHLVSEAWFDAKREDLYRVLTNYDEFHRFTSAFVDTRNVEVDGEGRPRFYTRMEGCLLWFCKSFVRNGYLVEERPHEVVAMSLPEQSDFNYSRERWSLKDEDGGTLMTYDFEMEPSFWVPPVIGPFIIKRTLRAGGVDAIDRIEAIAQGKEPKK
ncbi:MAG: SRPBCC family protein [Woeseiaceae bacterium]|nr:SRPBCC family protein [Woeseiaceae bacterium]